MFIGHPQHDEGLIFTLPSARQNPLCCDEGITYPTSIHPESTVRRIASRKRFPKNCVDLDRFCRKNLEKLDNCRGVGEKMTYAEFENLIFLADRTIMSCVPRKAEYGRGYQSGIKFHFYNPQPESLPQSLFHH